MRIERYEKDNRFGVSAFNCPRCGAFAQQKWGAASYQMTINTLQPAAIQLTDARISICIRCGGFALWVKEKLAWPNARTTPFPNRDLPDDIKADYEEASAIVNQSPRGAAALLRLAIQKLCNHLGEKGDINTMIGNLVKKGLSETVQKALDGVRVIGNEAVHPGTIDLNDTPETARALFRLVNYIAERMITMPNEAEQIFDLIPESKKDAIEKRDAAAKAQSQGTCPT